MDFEVSLSLSGMFFLSDWVSLSRYLHEVCLPSVVHRNFKSANILLDEELNPHLSDCGLAALTPNTERQVKSVCWQFLTLVMQKQFRLWPINL